LGKVFEKKINFNIMPDKKGEKGKIGLKLNKNILIIVQRNKTTVNWKTKNVKIYFNYLFLIKYIKREL
jgi:hypothetical protein